MKLRITVYTNPQTCQPCASFARDLDNIRRLFPEFEFVIINIGEGQKSPSGFIPYFLVEDVSEGEPASFVAALNIYTNEINFTWFLEALI